MFSRVLLRREDPATSRSSMVEDLESQPLSPTADPSLAPEMAERPQQGGFSRLGARRPTAPSRFRFSSSTEATSAVPSDWRGSRPAHTPRSYTFPTPRPTSSRYPGDDDYDYVDLESQDIPRVPPLPSRYSVVVDLPSARLDMPGLQRTWTHESGCPSPVEASHSAPKLSLDDNPYGPPDYPPLPTVTVTAPEPAARPTGRAHRHPAEDQYVGELFGEDGTAHAAREFFHGADPAEAHLAEMAEDGRRRRHHRRHRSDRERSGSDRARRHGHGHGHGHRRDRARREGHGSSEGRSGHSHSHSHGHSHGHSSHRRHHKRRRQRTRDLESGDDESEGPHPRHFMCCFPWVKSSKMRSQIWQCVVSGIFLIALLAIYFALNIKSSEFTVLMVIIIFIVAIFFCQGAVRLCMLKFRKKPSVDERRRRRLPKSYGPGGYAVPHKPIRVVLARDEEAVGIESEAGKTKPPAYGLWRESVRVDPNRIYWQRNPEADEAAYAAAEEREVVSDDDDYHHGGDDDEVEEEEEVVDDLEAQTISGAGGRRPPRNLRRPPSYASDDGVSYVVDATPRSVAPTEDAPLPVHPSEAGRVAQSSRWWW